MKKHTRKRLLGLCLGITAVLLLVILPVMSCCTEDDPTTNIYNLGNQTQPTTDNPFNAGIGQGDGLHFILMYEPLILQMFDGRTDPALAESWAYDTASMTWTINMNPDAKWSDGEPVTALDAKFTLDKNIELESGRVADLLAIVADVDPITAVDDHTLTIEIKTFAATFMRYLGNSVIVPEHIWGDMTNEALLAYPNTDIVGSGPYALREREINSHQIYDARPDYWGGAPSIDVIQSYFYATDEAELLAVKTGQIDGVTAWNLPTAIPQLLGDPDIKVFPTADNSTMTFYGNHRVEPWNLAAFRNAVSIVVNRVDMVAYAADGWANLPINLQCEPSFDYVIDGLEWDYVADTQVERIALANAALDDITGMSQTPDPIPEGGFVRTYNGDPLEFELLCATWTEHAAVTELLAENCAAVGIVFDINAISVSTLVGRVYRQSSNDTLADWDTHIWSRGFPSEYDYFAGQWQWDEEIVRSKRSSIVGWRTATAEAIGKKLLQLQALPAGNATRDALIAETQQLWADELPALPLYHTINAYLHRTDKYTGWIEDAGVMCYGHIVAMGAPYNILNLEPIEPI